MDMPDLPFADDGPARGQGNMTSAYALEQLRAWVDVTDGHVQPTELGRRFTNDVVSLFLEE